VTPSLPVGAEGSLFQRMFSSTSGIDPYSSAVSDVYQDLFGEGSYSGKGIYDIGAFEAALQSRVPDNTIGDDDAASASTQTITPSCAVISEGPVGRLSTQQRLPQCQDVHDRKALA
jgi:hypothetical protein